MKALKEKRISLRSLWRRGLVILSLFALVFASCSESGGGSTDEGKIVERTVVRWAPNTQYLGTRIDLSGVEVRVYYKGETDPKVIKDVSRFTTVPKVATGEYDLGTNVFTGLNAVDLYLDGFLCYNPAIGMNGSWPITTVDIARDNANVLLDDWMVTLPGNVVDRGYYSTGLHVDALNMKTKVVYADDDTFDWTGVRLQALYGDGQGTVAWKEIMPQDVMWYIIPDYTEVTGRPKDPATGAYAGWVYIYAGADVEGVLDPATAATNWRYGVSARIPLDVVYTVENITYTMDGETLDYFFWEANTPKAWETRLKNANFKLNVDYKGIGWKAKEFDIDDLAAMEKVWWNNNPVGVPEDFYVMPLSYPFTTKVNKDPALKVYYRGAWGEGKWAGLGKPLLIPVDVYTKLGAIDVRAKGASVGFDADDIPPGWDNDIWDEGNSATERDFVRLFDVIATYSTYNGNPVKTKEIPLSLLPTLTVANGGTGSGVFQAGQASGPYFVTNWDTIRSGIKKDQQTKAVKIIHTINANDVEDAFGAVGVANRQWYTYDLNSPINTLLAPDVQWLSGTRAGPGFDGDFHILSAVGSPNPNQQSKNKSIAVTWNKR